MCTTTAFCNFRLAHLPELPLSSVGGQFSVTGFVFVAVDEVLSCSVVAAAAAGSSSLHTTKDEAAAASPALLPASSALLWV